MIKKTAKFISTTALFLVPLFALIVADSFFFPFITGKAFYFRILVEVAFAGWLILAFMDAKYRPKWTPLTIGVSLFALITLIADLLGVNPIRSLWSNFERMEGWMAIVHLWAFFIAATGIFGSGEEGKRIWHRWINVQLGVAVIVAIYGILQLMGKLDIHQGSTRIDASLGNAAYMAVYMLWNTGLAAYMFCVARAKQIGRSGFFQWAYPIIAIIFGYEVFQTATRGTILGLIGGIMLALLLYAILAKNASKSRRWYVVGVIVLMLALGGVFWANRDAQFVKDSEVLSRMASISWSQAQGQARNYIWPMAVKGLAERPILGWGQENFNYVFNANYAPKMWNNEQWFDRAHSVFLDWMSASGIVGLLAYLALYVLFLVMVWKSSMTIGEKSILTGLIVGYAIHNIFVFDNIASYVLFFAALAFVNSFREGRPIKALGEKSLSSEGIAYIAAPAVLIALIAVLYAYNVRPMQANTRLIKALSACATQNPSAELFESALSVRAYVASQEIREQLLACSNRVLTSDQQTGQVKQVFFNITKQSIQDQIAATPFKDARIYVLAGSFMNMIARFEDALPLLAQAHELSPTKQSVNVEYATALINNRKPAEAVKILEADYAVTPENEHVRDLYALALVANQQEAKARQIFSAEPEMFETMQMAQAYTIANQLDKAIMVYKKFLEKNPNDLNASVQLARLQYTTGQKWEAVQTFRALQKAYPQYKDAIEAAIQEASR